MQSLHICARSGSFYCRGCLHNLLLNIQNCINQESLQVAQQTTVFCITHVIFPVDPQMAFNTKIFRNKNSCQHCTKTRKRKAEDANPNNNAQISRGKTLPYVCSINRAVDSITASYSQALQNTGTVSSTASGNIHEQQCVGLPAPSSSVNTQRCVTLSAAADNMFKNQPVQLCTEAEIMRQQQHKIYKYDLAEFFETGISSSMCENFADFLCLRLHSKNEYANSKNYAAFSVAYLQLHLRGLFAQLHTCCIMLDEMEEYLQNLQAVYDLHARIRSFQSSKIVSSKLHCFVYKNMRTYPMCPSLRTEFQEKLQYYSVPHTFYDSKWNEVEIAGNAKFVRLPLTVIWNFSSYRRRQNKKNIDKSVACNMEDIVGFELAEIAEVDNSNADNKHKNNFGLSSTWQEKIMLNDMVILDGNQNDCNGITYGREEILNKMHTSFCELGVQSTFVQKYNDITRKLQCSHKKELDLDVTKIAAQLRCLRNEFELDLKKISENSDIANKLHKIAQITAHSGEQAAEQAGFQSSNFIEILVIAADLCKVLRQELTTLHNKYACRFEDHLQRGNLNNRNFWKQNTTKFRNLYKFGTWSDECANFCVGKLHQILFKLYDNVSLCAQHYGIDSYMILIPQTIISDCLILGTKQNRDFFVLHIANLKLFMQSNFCISNENWSIFEQNLHFLNHKFDSISSNLEDIYALKVPMCLFLMIANFFNNSAWKMLCFGKSRLFFGIMTNNEVKQNKDQMCNYDFCEAGNSIYAFQYESSSYYL